MATLRKAIAAGFTLTIGNRPTSIEDLMEHELWVVGEQDPPAGSERYRMDTVMVWLRPARGGDAGDREPRNPLPLHHSGHGVPETID